MFFFGNIALVCDTCGCDCDDFELCVHGRIWLGVGPFLRRYCGWACLDVKLNLFLCFLC